MLRFCIIRLHIANTHVTKRGYGDVSVVTQYVFDSCCEGEQRHKEQGTTKDSLAMIFKYAIDAGLSGYSSKKLTP